MEVKRRILLGAYSLTEEQRAESYDRAVQARALLQKELERVLGSADALLFPTTATTAWPIGEKQDDPAQMYLSDLYLSLIHISHRIRRFSEARRRRSAPRGPRR